MTHVRGTLNRAKSSSELDTGTLSRKPSTSNPESTDFRYPSTLDPVPDYFRSSCSSRFEQSDFEHIDAAGLKIRVSHLLFLLKVSLLLNSLPFFTCLRS